jgi:predicted ATPase
LEVLKRQTEFKSRIRGGSVAFLDRGFVDALAYCRFYGIDAPKDLVEATNKSKYNGVFFLEMLPNYEVDSVRKEDLGTARKLHQTIRDLYLELDYDIIDVPALDVEKRVQIILSKIL